MLSRVMNVGEESSCRIGLSRNGRPKHGDREQGFRDVDVSGEVSRTRVECQSGDGRRSEKETTAWESVDGGEEQSKSRGSGGEKVREAPGEKGCEDV